jgi:methylated-DNA-protein-cysteine methyltransferase related protein
MSDDVEQNDVEQNDVEQVFDTEISKILMNLFALVQACPAGRVTTYGWLGKALGYPRGARMVGWMMHITPIEVPAHRVVNSKGELTGSKAFGQIGRMRKLLEDEGIIFSPNGRVSLERYGWDPVHDLSEEERQQLLEPHADISAKPDARLRQLLHDDPASPFKA